MKQATRFAKLVLLLALVGALALAGCGGGDGGLSAADQARIDDAEKAAVDAKAAADKAAVDAKAAADKAAVDAKAAADKAAVDAKAAADKAAADLKAAADKAAADLKAAADKAAAAEQATQDAATKAAAMKAAMAAADAAKVQSNDAAVALAEVSGSTNAPLALGQAAVSAKAAMDAYMAAKAASDKAAMDETSAADAQMYADMAEDELAKAEAANMAVTGYVATIKTAEASASEEMKALNDARIAATTAATSARQAATDAQTAANMAAGLVPADSPVAMDATTAATAAATAATAAEAASASAQAATTSANAMMYQATAEDEKKKAEVQLAAAKTLQTTAQTIHDAVEGQKAADRAENLTASRTGATAAMDAAKTATDAAKVAADDADEARKMVASIQTGGMSMTHAMDARKYAEMAQAEYMKAKTASEAAVAAETPRDALRAESEAEAAQTAAEDAQMKAETAQIAAESAAMMEMQVDGNTYRVAVVEITKGAGKVTRGKSMKTGMVEDLTTLGKMDEFGQTTTNGTDLITPENVNIGAVYDASDDSTRLALIDAYLGTSKQKVFVRGAATQLNATPNSDPPIASDTQGATIRPDSDGKVGGTTLTFDPDGSGADNAGVPLAKPKLYGTLTHLITLDDDSPVEREIYYIPSGVKDNTATEDIDEAKVFLEKRTDEDNAVTYFAVGVVEITLDDVSMYQHVSFGVWSGLGNANENTGDQAPDELGIGFVNASVGMTEEMPNFGTAYYDGNWVANVQEADDQGDGDIMRQAGVAMMTADFKKDSVDVDLGGLATLKGDISGNMFTGDKDADVADGHPFGLDSDGKFTGSFSGGFYGEEAVEAAGVFDYTSADMEAGAFRGSFGGRDME